MEVTDRVASLEQRVQMQEDDIQLLKSALADVVRRLNITEEQQAVLSRKGPTKGGCTWGDPWPRAYSIVLTWHGHAGNSRHGSCWNPEFRKFLSGFLTIAIARPTIYTIRCLS